MNDEIKELMTNIIYNEDVNGFICTDEHYKEIKNYITNLQQKVEQYENPDDLTLFYMWLDEKAKDKMKELQKENERLKDELETMTFTAKVKQEAIDALIKRIDKAIEYIEKEYQDNIIITDYADNPITPQELYGELLDILKGDSDV